jgi:hypothetical protein
MVFVKPIVILISFFNFPIALSLYTEGEISDISLLYSIREC